MSHSDLCSWLLKSSLLGLINTGALINTALQRAMFIHPARTGGLCSCMQPACYDRLTLRSSLIFLHIPECTSVQDQCMTLSKICLCSESCFCPPKMHSVMCLKICDAVSLSLILTGLLHGPPGWFKHGPLHGFIDPCVHVNKPLIGFFNAKLVLVVLPIFIRQVTCIIHFTAILGRDIINLTRRIIRHSYIAHHRGKKGDNITYGSRTLSVLSKRCLLFLIQYCSAVSVTCKMFHCNFAFFSDIEVILIFKETLLQT